MTRAEVVASLKECWMQYGADLLVDNNGQYDEMMTLTGAQIQNSIISELWLDAEPEHYAYFNSLISADKSKEEREIGWAEWKSVKAEAFPSDNLYGA